MIGPTSSGKSALAVELARVFNGEIVSADSRQVYKGLDIGTGKITKRETEGIPHHLIDVANPRHIFTAAEYVKKANEAISGILKRRKLPIIAGGTAFYIDALLGAIPLARVPRNEKLRAALEKEATESLAKKLERLNPARAKTVDIKNRRRLIRAIEIALSKTHADRTRVYTEKSQQKLYNALKIGITIPKELLREKIQKRLKMRITQGMVAEARRLHTKGLSYARMEELGLEYRLLARFLQKKITKEEMIVQLETAIWHYAKRQMTWWKRDKEILWFPLSEKEKGEAIKKTISSFFLPSSKF